MSVPESVPQPVKTMKFIPHFLLRDIIGWLTALAALAALAALFPWELGVKADPFAPAPAGIRPEWFFMFMFETLKLLPARIAIIDGEVLGVLAFGVGAFLLLIVPFIDREAKRRTRRFLVCAGVFTILYISTLTLIGYLT
jgi:quinol-cytochrome oxidoreductase complex cytochrome b subunit